MVPLRFPTATFAHLPTPPPPHRAAIAAAIAAAAAAAAAAGFALTAKSAGRPLPLPRPAHSAPLWASLSLADSGAPGNVEPRTGAAFPSETAAGRRLLGRRPPQDHHPRSQVH
ncbi:fatty-acid-binding protein 1 [Hordeum vulgare]|nr:fatty-acid-binding protein 1 [Hordeum vulgare]